MDFTVVSALLNAYSRWSLDTNNEVITVSIIIHEEYKIKKVRKTMLC